MTVPSVQGRPIDPNNEMTLKNVRGTECLKLAWHPLLPLLTIGWRDGRLLHVGKCPQCPYPPDADYSCVHCSLGAISFWNAEERHSEEDGKTHRSPITSLNWNQGGDRLFTTDENAKVRVPPL